MYTFTFKFKSGQNESTAYSGRLGPLYMKQRLRVTSDVEVPAEVAVPRPDSGETVFDGDDLSLMGGLLDLN